MRGLLAWVLIAGAAAGCGSDRGRPGLVGPDTPLELSVQVLSPDHNDAVEAGREISVRIRAAETFHRLSGVGYVIRQFGSANPLDSTVVSFAVTDDTIHTFPFRIPPGLPTNAQLDVRGVAFGPAGQSRRSPGHSLVVIACPPAAAWCQ